MGRQVERVAVIGTGLIGASWASAFLAAGLDVTASDPGDGAAERLRASVAAHWPSLEAIGLRPAADPGRLTFASNAAEAVEHADFVQESGPEDRAIKRDLFAVLDAAAPPHAVIASSSSTIMVSEFQDACAHHPERIVLAHPFNPPHLIPLVEVAGGVRTSAAAIDTAMAFFRTIGKHPIHLKKEVRGHVANRLQAALWREAFHLAEQGVASVADIDAAIAHGPGLRWALLGPFMNLDLSGGSAGIRGLLNSPLGAATRAMWDDLGAPSDDPGLTEAIAAGVADARGGRERAEIVAARDAVLIELLRRKADAAVLP
ncbi:3-hydroxyacyl-CoA dehydrogenase NAD-binding domain-containing protein [Acuticoccus kandeliae]|uniref:3-hydroxyacyl-CoA dehydrogenase NAD-binding domain-containing protein n=1 Tax=Acuticoccus kandeliae TaxID=2073160 RepID=UPI00196B9C8B|nr:3-hydroxyacyl-CoA dehydrogenase NAD-binding domain-containing protein [Acuticoccus kandeliae]